MWKQIVGLLAHLLLVRTSVLMSGSVADIAICPGPGAMLVQALEACLSEAVLLVVAGAEQADQDTVSRGGQAQI